MGVRPVSDGADVCVIIIFPAIFSTYVSSRPLVKRIHFRELLKGTVRFAGEVTLQDESFRRVIIHISRSEPIIEMTGKVTEN